ncbi:hypothetical protein A4D02_29375 [Niastella koreensis]|uniref:Uncharacterized protein n=2 Tax=Niastella koreensis TaxID=354356 RepID=G8TQL9_NIAKG|nr:hypothetical protein [Niastella koreensis]AEV96753.1 hypothetical protein Niako_0355 [Niastella koreensis GR20-10]OQP49110.1 hypothetical protein A4D02_29375 [Niastella koreensis]
MDKKNLKEELPEDVDLPEEDDDNDDNEYDILDELTPEQLARLQESIKQLEAGSTLPHERAMALMSALLERRSRQNL